MKRLHRPDLYAWSAFDEARDIDFHSVLWHRPGEGNVAIDPLPLSAHDRRHVEALGGVAVIVVTNSDHTRGAEALASWSGAEVLVPRAEHATMPVAACEPVGEGDDRVRGLRIFELEGSKTAGELALLLEDHTLVFGDLVRAHRANEIHLLPPEKLRDLAAARASLRRLLAFESVEALLLGDGWSVFRDGHARLRALLEAP